MKVCPVCRRDFEPSRSSQVYCGSDCRIAEHNRRSREAIRVKRGSFAPHRCLGVGPGSREPHAPCAETLVGRALRCPSCAAENRRLVHRESKRRTLALDNLRRRERLAGESPARLKARAAWRTRHARLTATPEGREALNAARRDYLRGYAMRRRAEREALALESLAAPTAPETE